jgi:hypothetical protein
MAIKSKYVMASVMLSFAWPLASVLFASFSFVMYANLTDEKPIALVYFKKIDDQVYEAYLREQENDTPDMFQILGDQWRIDAKFIKLKSWANILGLDSQYSLERLEGRYANIDDQNNKKTISYKLDDNKLIEVPNFIIDYNFLIDANYGSSSYTNIDTSLFYTVYKTTSGIIIKTNKLEKPKEEPGFLERWFG